MTHELAIPHLARQLLHFGRLVIDREAAPLQRIQLDVVASLCRDRRYFAGDAYAQAIAAREHHLATPDDDGWLAQLEAAARWLMVARAFEEILRSDLR